MRINDDEVKEGLTVREEKFVDMPPDLLYIYASFYIHLFKGQETGKVKDLINELKAIDDTWKINNDENNNENLNDDFISRFFLDESTDELLTELNNIYFNTIKSNLQKKYIKLEASKDSKDSKDLFENVLPTAHKLMKLQGEELKVEYSVKDIGYLLPPILSFLLPLPLAIPLALLAVISLGTVGLINNVKYIAYKIREFRRDFKGYVTNITILKEALKINPEKPFSILY